MEYLIHIAILSAIFSILALSLNLIAGYTGLFSMAHAVFYAAGAYTTAILLTRSGMNFFLTVIIGVIVTAAVSLLIGTVLSRFSGDYYAIVSLGFGAIALALLLNWKGLTRGAFGIPAIQRPRIAGFVFSSDASFLLLSLSFAVIIFFLCRFIAGSSFGRVLRAVREDEETARVFGYNTTLYKLAVFVIGAMMASVAGSLYASFLAFIDPSVAMLKESIFIFVMIILGGLASLYGSILGACFLILLPEALRFVGLPDSVAAQVRQIIYGAILVYLMLFRPRGLIGKYRL